MTADHEAAPGASKIVSTKRALWLFSTAVAFIPAFAGLAILTTGVEAFAFAPLLIYYGVIPLLDMIAGEDHSNPTAEEASRAARDGYYRALLFLAIGGFYLSFFIAAAAAATGGLSPLAFLALAAGAGAASGGGLAVGHELGHKPDRAAQRGAFFMNALSGYGHFRLEHNRGHHADVATPEDSASARLGESVWRFALREVPGGVRRGWRFERRRLKALGRPLLSVENEILRSHAATAVSSAVLIAAFGPKAAAFIAVHHAVAWLQLTFANYVEHYGLLRARDATGRYEPCAPQHSWNSNHIVSNLILFHLQRHSDHHANPLAPYQALRDFDDLPRLPNGYPGCFLLAAIPPLWFGVMDRKVMDWADGDIGRVNVAPERRARYGMVSAGA